MARSKTSGRWLKEHVDDLYVQRARKENYRSRAVYKLIELDERDELLSPGMVVVELGAAPGGWTQYIARQVVDSTTEREQHVGRVIATDILPMDAIGDVTFVQGDFTEDTVVDDILTLLGGKRADLVLSDMAPNMSGVSSSDQARAMYLAELALDLARRLLRPGGHFVTKLFQGAGFEQFNHEMRQSFEKVQIRKPAASRSRSSEVYAVARNLFL